MNWKGEFTAWLKKEGRKAFIAYVTAGYPDALGTIETTKVLEAAGADIIEIGIPLYKVEVISGSLPLVV